MKLRSFKLKISAVLVDLEDGKEVVNQELVFEGRAPAIHHAIQNMGASYVYGLGVSLSKEVLGLMDEKKEEKKP
jgi:CRISPR/Cas system-associated endonuclease Cas3-HD